jgi:hypothetical protein
MFPEAVLPINNVFIRRLAAESARLPPNASFSLMFDDGLSVRERYAPMPRLLVEDDELFLAREGSQAVIKTLRREHRRCYFRYVSQLTREIRAARRLGTLAMASKENWSFGVLTARTVLSESSLLYLRWLGCRHALGITVAARDVNECLDFLLAAPKFHLATP